MKTSLDHLPEYKQLEIKRAVEIILGEAKVDMIILFGSYARGDWVEDFQPDGLNMHEYKSDLDLMLVVKNEKLVDKIEKLHSIEIELDRKVKTPASLLVEDITFLNQRIKEGQYFYADIFKEGILLHDSGKLKLESPQQLNFKQRKNLAVDDFEYWFNSANEYFRQYTHAIADESHNVAAFNLHQVAERLISALLLVVVYYKPNTHDLLKLYRKASAIDRGFSKIFPQDTPEEKQLFELLRKAYVDARYKKTYKITKEELLELQSRVDHIQALTEEICKKTIESFNLNSH
jgi:predicted nucleotidyltransferase/HEPN domain-containing protein